MPHWDCVQLINRYALLNDEHRWEAAAALYTPDGLMTRPTAPDQPIIGRDAILASFLARPPRVTRHVCANIVVEPDGERAARAQSVILLFTGQPVEGGLPRLTGGAPLIGEYRDRLVLTDQGWRFQERRGALLFQP